MNSYLFRGSFVCLLALLLLCQQSVAQEKNYHPYPQPDGGYVTDHANLLTDSEESRLERWLLQTEEQSKVEIIVVTINSLSDYHGTDNGSIESFAKGLFNRYGIGNLPKNDGVLLVISKNDRRARIELGKHYGKRYDGDANHIMQNIIIPKFKNDNYAAGITNGTQAIIKNFANLRVGFPWLLMGAAVGGPILLLIGVSCVRSGRRGWGYVFIGIGIVLILFAIFVAKELLKRSLTAGGSGGFGGGSSGGGGASGGW